jgi:sigma-E factor negative regulatory protein RseA
MSEKLKESLSAVMDGEADEFEIKRVLNEASSNPELMSRWHRYHLIGHLVRSEYVLQERAPIDRFVPNAPDAMLSRIWSRVDADPLEVVLDAAGNEVSADPAHAAPRGAGSGAAGPLVGTGVASESQRGRGAWLGPMTGVAVAASVALVVVLGLGGLDRSTPAGVGELAHSPVTLSPSLQAARTVTDRHEVSEEMPSQVDQHRVQAYMLHHVHHTSLNNQASVVPFVKVAAFESR